MDPKPQEEKVLKNTEFEYESEVSNPHPEIPDDYKPQDDKEKHALARHKLGKDKEKMLKNASDQLEQLQQMQARLSQTLEQATEIKELLYTLAKKSNWPSWNR